MSSSNELEAFRISIALTEGGGKIDYTQGNSETGAYGAYQFVPKWWDWYSTEAGYPGADIKDPAAQDAVALYWFNRNYNDLGSWEFAAVAHFAGRDTAFKGLKNGFDSIKNIKDSTGTTIEQYVNKTMQNYKEQKPKEDMKLFRAEEQQPTFYTTPVNATEIVDKEAATVLDAVSTAVSDGGRKKFPMNTKAQYNSQVPKQADSYNKAMAKTDYNRFEMQ